MSCPIPPSLPACLSINLSVCLFLSFSLHLSKFVHLIRHHLFINPLCCYSNMWLFERSPCFVSLSLSAPPASSIQMSIHMAHTHIKTTPPLVCVDVQPSTNPSADFILSSTSNHCPSHLRCSIQLFFFFLRRVYSKGFMIPLEALLSVECDLGKMLCRKSNR